MTDSHDVWLKSDEEKLRSLISDEAKMMPMLDNMQATVRQLKAKVRQLKAKQQFRLALLNQLLEDLDKND
jgi:hypothetical protein